MRRWLGFSEGTPARPKTAVLTSGTDVLMLSDPHGGTELAYTCPGMFVNDIDIDGDQYEILNTADGNMYGEPGSPMLPTAGQFIAIPRVCDLERIETTVLEFELLDNLYDLPPHPQPTREAESLIYARDPAIYERNAFYPDVWFLNMGQRVVSGASIRHIILYNAKYNPVTKAVIALKYIQLRFVYNDSGRILSSNQRFRADVSGSLVHDLTHTLYMDNKRAGHL